MEEFLHCMTIQKLRREMLYVLLQISQSCQRIYTTPLNSPSCNLRKWPYPSTLHEVRDHDYYVNSLLPYHSPKGVKCGWQRTLCSNVTSCLVVTVNVIGIDIFNGLLLSREGPQWNTSVVI